MTHTMVVYVPPARSSALDIVSFQMLGAFSPKTWTAVPAHFPFPCLFCLAKTGLASQVGQSVFGADVYSSNHKTSAEAQKARQLQHSIGSGDILAMHERSAK